MTLPMIEIARKYMFATPEVKAELMKYYNDHCVALVKRERRYKMKAGDNWCAMFTSVCAHMAGESSTRFPFEVSVGEQVKIAKAWGKYQQNVERARAGDLIIFNWNGDSWPDHVGFIQSVDNGIITTIEGNYHDTVGERHIACNSKFIAGIIELNSNLLR